MTPARIVALGALALSLVPIPAPSSSIDTQIQAQRRRTDELHARLLQKRTELGAATVRVGNLQTQTASHERRNRPGHRPARRAGDRAAQYGAPPGMEYGSARRRNQDAQTPRRLAQAAFSRRVRARRPGLRERPAGVALVQRFRRALGRLAAADRRQPARGSPAQSGRSGSIVGSSAAGILAGRFGSPATSAGARAKPARHAR